MTLTLDTSACFTLDAMSTYCQTLCPKHNARRRCFLHDCFALCVNARFMLASRGKAAAAEAAASKRGRRRGCGRVGVRVGGRTGWAQSATHLLVARRLDATVLSRSRLPGRLAGTCGVGCCALRWCVAHVLPLTIGNARQERRHADVCDLLESVTGRQCSWSAAPSTTVLAAGRAQPGSRAFARGQA